MDALEVDGSFGEGGGQILRTAAVFSVVQGRPIHVTRIRAGRATPGLKKQHVTTLKALAMIFDADLSGADEGSSEVRFSPGAARLGRVDLDTGSAASITLLLQAVVPAVALSKSSVELRVRGGTDVPWSPTFDYLSTVLREAYGAIGIRFEARAERRGYYPRGGGIVTARVAPSTRVSPLDMGLPRGSARVSLMSRCAGLPRSVADRQMQSMEGSLAGSGVEVAARTVAVENADSPGTSVLAWTTEGGRMIGADAIGERGKPAESVGREAAEKFVAATKSRAPVDANLADMVVPLLSLADGPSTVTVPAFTPHLETGLHIAKVFTGCEYRLRKDAGVPAVEVRPARGHNA